jgi:hypothetical protein
MGKSVRDQDEQKTKNKAVKAPRKKGGKTAAAGKGGKPAAAKKPKRATKSKAAKEAEKAAEKAEEFKQAAKGAKKALRRAVKAEVKQRSEKIAKSLVDNVERGDVRLATLVISLMEKKKEGDAEPEGPSMADLLAAEPEWDEEMEAKLLAKEKERALAAKEPLQLTAGSEEAE